ncbi:antirestriction protein ArdA [Spirillospora sp. NPDC047279]|uniref:antirestriction protein ArdA n=1 Tax=Spirillospora sp. NPDC047279 TaxID=3155478 RepID=UPI00340A35F9
MLSIYVACLAAYNDGELHGRWLDLKDYDSQEELVAAIEDMLAASPVPDAEEFAIHDYESTEFDTAVEIHEYAGTDYVWRLEMALRETSDPDAFAAFLSYHGNDLTYAMDYFEEAYHGLWSSIEDYALEFFEDVYGDVNFPGFRISVDTVAWESEHTVIDARGGVYVFSCI